MKFSYKMSILSLSRHWISLHFSKSCIFRTLLLPLPYKREIMTEVVEWREAEQASWRREDQSYGPWGCACGGWLTRSPLSNTEGYWNFSVVLSSLSFFPKRRQKGRWLCKVMWKMTLCVQTHALHSYCDRQLLSLALILGEEKGKFIWLFSGSFSERCSVLQWNSEGSLIGTRGGETFRREVGYHCWHLPAEVELREGCGHKKVAHCCIKIA